MRSLVQPKTGFVARRYLVCIAVQNNEFRYLILADSSQDQERDQKEEELLHLWRETENQVLEKLAVVPINFLH